VKRSTERFLTTHTGSLPRPDDLIRMMFAREEGVPVDSTALAARVAAAVDEIVRRQVECGLDVVNDGEMSKPSYATTSRTGSTASAARATRSSTRISRTFPSWPSASSAIGPRAPQTPACNGPIAVRDPRAAQSDAEVVRPRSRARRRRRDFSPRPRRA